METDEKLWQHERMSMYDQNDAITITICSIVFDQKKRSVITIMTYILRQNVVETLHFVYAFCLCRMPVRKNVTIWYVFFCVLPLDVLPKRNRIQTNKQPIICIFSLRFPLSTCCMSSLCITLNERTSNSFDASIPIRFAKCNFTDKLTTIYQISIRPSLM